MKLRKLLSILLILLIPTVGFSYTGWMYTGSKFQAFDSNGDTLTGGKLHTYICGTTTNKSTYPTKADAIAGTNANANPVVLDSRGEANVFATGCNKFVLKTSADVTIWTTDNIDIGYSSSQSYYYPNYEAADNCATGNSDTIKYAIDTCSTDACTIVLQHNSGGARTEYICDTDETAGENIRFVFEEGAEIKPGVGDTLTVNRPENIVAADTQQIIDMTNNSTDPLAFTYGGRMPSGWWGTVADDSTDSTAAFFAWSAAVPDESYPFIPPGIYKVDGDAIAFDAEVFTVTAYGATIRQYGTVGKVTVDLNSAATADGANTGANVYWYGGKLDNNTAYGSNTNIGFQVRDISRGRIQDTLVEGFGGAGVMFNPTDGFHLDGLHGYNNKYHVYCDGWNDEPNPQGCNIINSGFSTHGTAAILFDQFANDIKILNNYFVGDDAIVISTGKSPSQGSLSVKINNNTFEQGTTGEYYIRTYDPNTGKILQALTVNDNTFQVADTLVLQLINIDTFNFIGNMIVSTQDSSIDIDADSNDIHIHSNEWVGSATFTQAIAYACPRYEIYAGPPFLRDPVVMPSFNQDSFSTGTGTIDVSAEIGTYWLGWCKIIPPRAYNLVVAIRDSDSENTNAKIILKSAVGATSNFSNQIQLMTGYNDDNLVATDIGTKNNTYIWQNMFVHADANGDFYYDMTASGASTLDAIIAVQAIYF